MLFEPQHLNQSQQSFAMGSRDVDVIKVMADTLPDLAVGGQLIVFTVVGDRERATPQSVEKNFQLMKSILSKFPTSAPAKSTLKSVLREYCTRRQYCELPSSWLPDETDKFHKIWRYVYANFRRTTSSRNWAMRELKKLLDFLCMDHVDSDDSDDSVMHISDSDDSDGNSDKDNHAGSTPCPRTLSRTITVASSPPRSPCRQPMSSNLLSEPTEMATPTTTPARPRSRKDESSKKLKKKNKAPVQATTAASTTKVAGKAKGEKKKVRRRLSGKTPMQGDGQHLPLRPPGPNITSTVTLADAEADDGTLTLLEEFAQQLQIDADPAAQASDICFTDMQQRDKWIHQFRRRCDGAVCQVTPEMFGQHFFQASAFVRLALLRGYSTESLAIFKKKLLMLRAD